MNLSRHVRHVRTAGAGSASSTPAITCGQMPVVMPPAYKLNAETGEYGPCDDATSGGDIGAQVPIFPVVWVRDHRLKLDSWNSMSEATVHVL